MGHSHSLKANVSYNTSGIDSKSKVLMTAVLILTILLTISFEQLLLFFGYSILLIRRMKVQFRSLFKKIFIPAPLIFSLSLLAFLSSSGEVSFRFGDVVFNYSPVETALFYFVRSMLLVFFSLLLIESESSFFEVIYALEELGLPLLLVNVLMFMYRTALDLEQEAQRMLDARYSRSPHKKWSMSLYTYRVLAYMLAGIFIRAFTKREIRRDALISRGFSGKLYHRRITFSFSGLLLLWVSIIISIMILLGSSVTFLQIGSMTVGGR